MGEILVGRIGSLQMGRTQSINARNVAVALFQAQSHWDSPSWTFLVPLSNGTTLSHFSKTILCNKGVFTDELCLRRPAQT